MQITRNSNSCVAGPGGGADRGGFWGPEGGPAQAVAGSGANGGRPGPAGDRPGCGDCPALRCYVHFQAAACASTRPAPQGATGDQQQEGTACSATSSPVSTMTSGRWS